MATIVAMPKLPDRAELRERLNRPADTMPVRAMALICFSSAALLLFGLLFNAENLPTGKGTRATTTAITAGAGVIYWVFARHFRAWMLQAIISIGLFWGFYGLAHMNTQIGSAMTILTIFWTCLLIGSIYRPSVARVYGLVTFIGIAIGLHLSPAATAENSLMAFSFGLTFVVTMEIMSRTSTRLREDATHDPLTGLLNRNGFDEAASRAVRVALRRSEPIAVASLDLNEFKAVNDRQGHEAGDRILAECAAVWSENVRAQDILGRYGGDEFVLLLPGATKEEAEALLERLQGLSPAPFSFGVAIAEPGDSIEARLRDADAELIKTKAALHRPQADPASSATS